jgi:hypothetical protein
MLLRERKHYNGPQKLFSFSHRQQGYFADHGYSGISIWGQDPSLAPEYGDSLRQHRGSEQSGA